MRLVFGKSFKAACLLFIAALACAATTASAQDARLQLTNLDRLESRATKTFDLNLDGKILEITRGFLNANDPEEAAIRDLVGSLKGIYVRIFDFDKEGEYAAGDVEAIRAQLRSPAWSRTAGVTSKREGENLEVYMMLSQNGQINGIAVVGTSPKQLLLVNIVGSLDLEKLMKLRGKFGIPSLEINTDKKTPKE